MTLTELAPRFFVSPYIGMAPTTPVEEIARTRRGMGLSFNCPCGCGERRQVAFLNPLDGGPAAKSEFPLFVRVTTSADTWDGLSLESFEIPGHGRWTIHRGQVEAVCG